MYALLITLRNCLFLQIKKLATNGFGFITCLHLKARLKKSHIPFFQLDNSFALFQKIQTRNKK
jgi:hypothetical protein